MGATGRKACCNAALVCGSITCIGIGCVMLFTSISDQDQQAMGADGAAGAGQRALGVVTINKTGGADLSPLLTEEIGQGLRIVLTASCAGCHAATVNWVFHDNAVAQGSVASHNLSLSFLAAPLRRAYGTSGE